MRTAGREAVRLGWLVGLSLAYVAAASVLVWAIVAGLGSLTRAYGQTWTPIPDCAIDACSEDAVGQMTCRRGFFANDQNECELANAYILRDNRGGFDCPTESSPGIDPEWLIVCDRNPNDPVEWVFRIADQRLPDVVLSDIESQIFVKQNGALVGQAHTLDFDNNFSLTEDPAGEINISTAALVSLLGQTIEASEASTSFLLADTTARTATVDNKLSSAVNPSDAMSLGPSPWIFGGGDAGPLTLADNPDGTACTACNALCTGGCTFDSPVCTCEINPNSHFGAFLDAAKPSVLLSLESLTIGENWRVVNGWAGANAACSVADERAFGQITLLVRGDAVIDGEIDQEGAGGCRPTGGTAAVSTAGKIGAWTMFPASAQGAGTGTGGTAATAHTVASVLNLHWMPSEPVPLLAGGGSGSNPATGQTTPRGMTGFLTSEVGGAYFKMLGGSGGSGGGCGSSGSGTVGTCGNGGGGVVIVAAGDLSFGASSAVTTAGTNGGTGCAGGGGGSALFAYGGSFTDSGGSFDGVGGTAGTALTSCGANAAGMAGQHVACSMRTGECDCLYSGDSCASY